MGNIWKADDCPECGELRAWGPHEITECLINLKKKLESLEEMVIYLRDNKVDKVEKKKVKNERK